MPGKKIYEFDPHHASGKKYGTAIARGVVGLGLNGQ